MACSAQAGHRVMPDDCGLFAGAGTGDSEAALVVTPHQVQKSLRAA